MHRGLSKRSARAVAPTGENRRGMLVIAAACLLGSSHFVPTAAAVAREDSQAALKESADIPPPVPAEENGKKLSNENPPFPEPQDTSNPQPTTVPPPSEPLKVKTATVKRGPLEKSLRFLTSLEATGQISIPAACGNCRQSFGGGGGRSQERW